LVLMAQFLSVAALLLVTLAAFPPPAHAARWRPASDATWQIQFSGDIDLSLNVDLFDLDMFETTTRMVGRIHRDGRHAVCYINAGAWENWRPDAGDYPSSVKGKPLDGWPGERWLDIRRLDVLGPILEARLDRCSSKGFDGVEFDNVEGYQNATGFGLSRSDQLAFNRWLADAAHQHGLAVGLKNALGIADELEPDFDFAVVEQCFFYRECGLVRPFVDVGKSVIVVEYDLSRDQFCAKAARLAVVAMRKHLSLDAWRRPC
jgi:hypothetical protein